MYDMIFAFIESSVGYGGIQVLCADFIRHVLNHGNQVVFITDFTLGNQKSVYFELLNDVKDQIQFIDSDNLGRPSLLENSDFDNLRKKIYKAIPDKFADIVAFAYYFETVQLAIRLFGEYKNAKLFYFWPHPLAFIRELTLGRMGYVYSKIKNRQYYYQRKLIIDMNNNDADFSLPVPCDIFVKWYYDIDREAKERNAECGPVRNIQPSTNYHYDSSSGQIKVLWVGRFDYFKNDAIVYIWKTLERIAEKHQKTKFIYNIIGGGGERFENDLRSRISPQNVEVNYLGIKKPEELPNIYVENDIGISMGLTIKQMAMCGLPAVLIDSLSDKYKPKRLCNWIFDTQKGDAGDGMYYYMATGKILDERVPLAAILNEILSDPEKLNTYSVKCKEYVKKYYDFDQQNEKIYKAALGSKLNVSDVKPFRYFWPMRLIYKIHRHRRMA